VEEEHDLLASRSQRPLPQRPVKVGSCTVRCTVVQLVAVCEESRSCSFGAGLESVGGGGCHEGMICSPRARSTPSRSALLRASLPSHTNPEPSMLRVCGGDGGVGLCWARSRSQRPLPQRPGMVAFSIHVHPSVSMVAPWLRVRFQGFGFRVSGFGFQVSGFEFGC